MADLVHEVLGAAMRFAMDRVRAALEALLTDAAGFAAGLGLPGPAAVVGSVGELDPARTALAAAVSDLGAVQPDAAAAHFATALDHLDKALLLVQWPAGQPPVGLDSLLTRIAGAGGAPSALAQQLGLTAASTLSRSGTDLTVRRTSAASVGLGAGPAAGHLDGVELAATLRLGGGGPPLSLTLTVAEASIGIAGDGLAAALLGGSAGVKSRLVITVSSDLSLHVGGGLATTVELPAVTAGGPLQVHGLELSAPEAGAPNAGGLTLGAAVSVDTGGATFLLTGAGLRVGFDGARLTLAVRPPDGVGITVDSGAVRGGGYLASRSEPGGGTSYEGALDLRLGTIEVKAFGILGVGPPAGFALIIVMTAEFAPAIELGLGFSLNGVGGIVGIQHAADVDALSGALSAHTLDSLLFPADPVSAAPRILATLRSVFPVRSGSAVFGPMVRLGWGRPSFVTADLGVILSLPDPVLVIIGRLRIRIPGEFLPIVSLTADILGVITPEKLFIRAGLVDSTIAGFTLGGDFGMLIRYSGDPEFALSAGGFHPAFTPPPELRGMNRMSIDMSPPAVLTLRAEAYAAITSATIQFGAKVEIGIDLAIAGADGHLSFDAIIRFLPEFGFLADIDVGVRVHAFGFTLCSVSAHLSLSGTSPWRAVGTGSADFGFFGDVDLDFGPIQWGDPTKPPAVTIKAVDVVTAALAKPAAWAPVLPAGGNGIVHLRALPPSAVLPLHPLGRLEVRQSLLPLETEVTHVGAAVVEGGMERLSFGLPTLGGGVSPSFTGVQDHFAMGQFLDLDDAASLARPAFEQRLAGLQIAPADFTAGKEQRELLTYETFVAGGTGDPPPVAVPRRRDPDFVYGLAAVDITLAQSGVSRSRLRDPYADHATAPVSPLRLADPGDVLLRSAETLAPVAGLPAQSLSFTDATETLAASGVSSGAVTLLRLVGSP
jgi:hypothetical protein